MAVTWQEWNDDVLRVAREERRPVLLSIVASWCRFCREMDRSVWSDPDVEASVGRHAIPVRVDKDLRPDIDARYGQGGWPSTVLLDPDGQVMAGGTFVEAEPLATLVAEAARRLHTEGPTWEPAPLPTREPTGRLDASILPAIERSLLQHFDSKHGGFGTGQKFPHPEAIDFALLRQADQAQPRLREVIEKTLTHMAEGKLQDPVERGFFRFCSARDWRQPHTEKLLETNTGLLRNYLEAGQLMQRQDFLDVGEATVAAIFELLYEPTVGLFHASLDADEEYYGQDLSGRRTRRAPRPDGRFLADANARAVSALLKAGAVLGRPDLTERAVAVMHALIDTLWRRGHGMSHYDDGGGARLPDLLRDQAETARALLHVLQYTDERAFREPLVELLGRMAELHVNAAAELVNLDEVGSPASARRRDTAILDNAAAAEVLLRGALFTGRPEFARVARTALEVHTEDFRRYGYAMAAYGRAVELVLHPPLHIVVVGCSDDAAADALFRAASTSYLPSRVVQRLRADDEADAEQIARLELPAREQAVAYICLEHDCAAEHTEPDTLWAALAAANARRRLG